MAPAAAIGRAGWHGGRGYGWATPFAAAGVAGALLGADAYYGGYNGCWQSRPVYDRLWPLPRAAQRKHVLKPDDVPRPASATPLAGAFLCCGHANR